MERPQREEMPLHTGVLSDAGTSEEILLNNPENSSEGNPGNTGAESPEGVIDTAGGNTASGIIGNAGETGSPTRLSNDGGIG
jgi:hypothetical protein